MKALKTSAPGPRRVQVFREPLLRPGTRNLPTTCAAMATCHYNMPLEIVGFLGPILDSAQGRRLNHCRSAAGLQRSSGRETQVGSIPRPSTKTQIHTDTWQR